MGEHLAVHVGALDQQHADQWQHGLPPDGLAQVLGRSFRHDVAKGTPLSWDLV